MRSRTGKQSVFESCYLVQYAKSLCSLLRLFNPVSPARREQPFRMIRDWYRVMQATEDCISTADPEKGVQLHDLICRCFEGAVPALTPRYAEDGEILAFFSELYGPECLTRRYGRCRFHLTNVLLTQTYSIVPVIASENASLIAQITFWNDWVGKARSPELMVSVCDVVWTSILDHIPAAEDFQLHALSRSLSLDTPGAGPVVEIMAQRFQHGDYDRAAHVLGAKIEQFIPATWKRDVLPENEALISRFMLALLPRYILAELGPCPGPCPDMSRTTLACHCSYCSSVNKFLLDRKKQTGEFHFYAKFRKHVEEHLDKLIELQYHHGNAGSRGPAKFTVSKKLKSPRDQQCLDWENRHTWLQARIKFIDSEFRPSMKRLLGDHYRDILSVNVDAIKDISFPGGPLPASCGQDSSNHKTDTYGETKSRPPLGPSTGNSDVHISGSPLQGLKRPAEEHHDQRVNSDGFGAFPSQNENEVRIIDLT